MAVADNISPLETLPFTVNMTPRRPPAADSVLSRLLGAAAAESITIPGAGATKAKYVRLAATDNIFVSWTTTATVPGDVTDGTACELIKSNADCEWFYIPPACTAISVISSGTPIVTASFYRD